MKPAQIREGRTYRGTDGSRRRVLMLWRYGSRTRGVRHRSSQVKFRSAMTMGTMRLERFAQWAVSDVTKTEPLPPLVRTTYLKRLPWELCTGGDDDTQRGNGGHEGREGGMRRKSHRPERIVLV